jgi:phosphonate transport system ATP-binding protein
LGGLESSTSGTISFEGKDVTFLTPGARNIAMVFQDYALYPHMNVLENISYPLKVRKFSKEEINKRVTQASEALSIQMLLDRKPGQISGGQQQRAALARCLVQKAKIILADEPIASLDPEASRKVMALLQQLNQTHHCTILVSLHQVEYAIRYCARTIALNAGRVVYDGPSAALTPQLLADLYGSSAEEFFKSNSNFSSPEQATSLGTVALV